MFISSSHKVIQQLRSAYMIYPHVRIITIMIAIISDRADHSCSRRCSFACRNFHPALSLAHKFVTLHTLTHENYDVKQTEYVYKEISNENLKTKQKKVIINYAT